jgi:NitT/TauT family transport system substrate-binding protein
MPLRIGHLSTFYHTSILLTARGGIDDVMGTDVLWKLFGTGPAIVDAFRRGEIDMAYIGLPPAIIGIDRGVKIKCVAGGHIEGTVLIGRDPFKGFPESGDLSDILRQFRGLKIGVPAKGSIHDVIISEYLDRFSLKDEIMIVNFQWADQIVDALYKGQLSAAVGTPALAVALDRYAGGKVLYPPSRLWPDNPSYGILVENNFLNEQRGTVERFLVLHEEATAFFRNNPTDAAKIIADYIGIVDEAFIMDTLKISPKYCAQITNEYISSTMEFVKVLKKLGYISREVSSGEIFDTSLIKKIHPEEDHYSDVIEKI